MSPPQFLNYAHLGTEPYWPRQTNQLGAFYH